MTQRPDETWAKSYRYVRITIVALLVSLGISVIYQTSQQNWHLLASVSAYYYTPAQGIFVGTLTGFAASMIALRGTTDREDVLLNLGGMFAVVVAVVPTARGQDYQTAARLCDTATENLPPGVDCPSVRSLAAATLANVENSMVALLVVGLLSLLVTIWLLVRHRRSMPAQPAPWWGIVVALVTYAATAIAFLWSPSWFVGHAHYLAAAGLFVCVMAVAVVNAVRLRREQADQSSGPPPRNRYSLVAALMIGVAVIGTVLLLAHVITLFWLEIAVAATFAVFWTVQTIEQMPSAP